PTARIVAIERRLWRNAHRHSGDRHITDAPPNLRLGRTTVHDHAAAARRDGLEQRQSEILALGGQAPALPLEDRSADVPVALAQRLAVALPLVLEPGDLFEQMVQDEVMQH